MSATRRPVAWVLSALVALLLTACAPARAPSAAAPSGAATPQAGTASRAAPTSGAAAPAKPDAQAAESFYRGKTLRFITGFSAGGAFDNYTRATARYLSKHLPGSPNVVVENMTGAGGLLATNYTFNVAPKDGTVLVNIDGAVIRLQALGQPGVEFDARRFNWLPSPGPDIQSCWVTAQSGWTSIGQAMGSSRELILGGLGPGSFPTDNARILQAALGLNMKLVDGYGGVNNVRLAAEGGEVDGSCSSYEGVRRSFAEQLQSGEIRVIAQVAEGAWPGLEQVPNALDLAPTESGKRLIRLGIIGPNDINRLFALPPGVPPERVAAMRQAIQATYDDPEFKTELERSQLYLRPIPVQRIDQVIAEWLDLSADQKAELKEILKY